MRKSRVCDAQEKVISRLECKEKKNRKERHPKIGLRKLGNKSLIDR